MGTLSKEVACAVLSEVLDSALKLVHLGWVARLDDGPDEIAEEDITCAEMELQTGDLRADTG